LEIRPDRLLLGLVRRREKNPDPPPMVLELIGEAGEGEGTSYESFPFSYSVRAVEGRHVYSMGVRLPQPTLRRLRGVVAGVSASLDPASVVPLTFAKLVEELRQLAAEELAVAGMSDVVKEVSELVAYESIGLSRILALARDQFVSEFYVDSDESPLYLDHSKVGRCDTSMLLCERERQALETHLDTFRGYTLDYTTPSLKNDMEISGARLRVSLDLDPIAVNRFSLDVRRLNVASLSLKQLIQMNVLTSESAAFLVSWLELGGNITIVGETGTGKTTLLNALDEAVNPSLRRVYIEDAVETKELLGSGYHQMKIKVDPFERRDQVSRTKETEIVKALHRSPDLVILSEIQSEEHSHAFFHALSAGIRGIQTFHASSVEQAVRRWVSVHGIPKQSLLDLGILVQMVRPDRLKPFRAVSRICEIVAENGEPRLRDVYGRDRSFALSRIAAWERVSPPEGRSGDELMRMVEERLARAGEVLVAG
jgi:type IV secretory pathway ATPase VirB11/archaellum biosynthesis ATPase